MKHPILVAVFSAATAWSALPVQFTAGQPAKAAEMNQNFSYVDSISAKKANRTSLDSLGALLKSKADSSTISTSVSSALGPVNTSLRAKLDTGALTSALAPIKTKLASTADTASVSKRIADTAKALRSLIGSGSGTSTPTYPTEYIVQGPDEKNHINNSPWYGVGLSNLASGANFLVQLGGYYGLNLQTGGGYPMYLRSAEHEMASFNYDKTVFSASDAGVLSISKGYVGVEGDLSVAGAIYAPSGSVKVPDYVFEPGYSLTPLSAVEAYTKENKHLPEVPAAAEIEKTGVNLAQMNLTLLKKIEELTLHAIAQEKRLEAQDQTIAEIRASLESLKAR